MNEPCDVVAVNLETNRVRLLETAMDSESSEDFIRIFVLAGQEAENEFLIKAPAGSYKDGDEWSPTEKN